MSRTSLSQTAAVIARAQAFKGIRAGIVRLKDVLQGPSYRADSRGPVSSAGRDDGRMDAWPVKAQTVLVLGLRHPREDLRLDYWEGGDTWGNRHLREISVQLQQWMRQELSLAAHPLPYHLEKGGLFLKDAAVLAGLGIIGKSNLLLHPEWGPKIRLRSMLMEGEFQRTAPIEGFAPCETCEMFCRKACPVQAFPRGKYNRVKCMAQIEADVEKKVPEGDIGPDGKRRAVIKYCRACEFSCPVGE